MKEAIRNILQQKNNPIKRIELFFLIHQRGFAKATDRAIRKAVEEMIEEGDCIASSEQGYQLITKPEQLLAAVDYLRKKSKAIAVRGNFLIHNWRAKNQDSQLKLELFTV